VAVSWRQYPANQQKTLMVGGLLIVAEVGGKFAAGFIPFWFGQQENSSAWSKGPSHGPQMYCRCCARLHSEVQRLEQPAVKHCRSRTEVRSALLAA